MSKGQPYSAVANDLIVDHFPFTARIGNVPEDVLVNDIIRWLGNGMDIVEVRVKRMAVYVDFANQESLVRALERDGQHFQGRIVCVAPKDLVEDNSPLVLQRRSGHKEPLTFGSRAEGAAMHSLLGDVDRHFEIEKESASPTTDRGVLLMRHSFVPLVVVGAPYLMLYWYWSLYTCFALHLILYGLAFVWWQLLLTGRVFWAKVLFLLNWYLSVIATTMVLTKESGVPIACIVLAGIWTILFDIDLSKPLLCAAVIVVSSGLWALLQAYDGPWFLRENLASSQVARIDAVLLPLVTITTIIFVCVLIWWLKTVNKGRESQLRHECALVDRIVLGLLPSQIVERLKQGERLIADWRPMACILFMDIVGFTEMCTKLAPHQVVQGLVGVFSQIESAVKKYPRVEKVKTIGDAFMCSSGLLDSHPTHDDIVQVARLALELQATSFLMQIDDETFGRVEVPIMFRFGIHCGEVIAGVISKERFTFDVLGDTVNTASRMESTSAPNMIQVSSEVKASLEHLFEFRDNGIHHVKGKGQMHTYYLVAPVLK